jgi:ribonuclease HI
MVVHEGIASPSPRNLSGLPRTQRFVSSATGKLSFSRLSAGASAKEGPLSRTGIIEFMTDKLFKDPRLIIYTDGGSRGNPGPAAIGVVVGPPAGGKKYSEYIGEATNNVAEYSAVVFALKKAKLLLGKKRAKETDVEVNVDSELIVKQLGAEYKIKEESLFPFFIQIWNLQQDFKSVIFNHVSRERNEIADRLVNEALDRN